MKIAEKSLKSLEFDKILGKLATHAKMKQGKKLCYALVAQSDALKVQTQIDFTKEAKSILDMA